MTTAAEVFETLKYYIVDSINGTRRYYTSENKLHREDGPAVIWEEGCLEWWINGLRHREDGPAIVYSDGGEEWFHTGKRHRLDGPAYIHTNGKKEWWQNGKPHRANGPAVEWDGNKRWFLHGVEYTEHQHRRQLKQLGIAV